MGRLASLYFGKRSLKDYKHTYHLPIAIFFYAFIGLFPAVFFLYSTFQAFTILKAAVSIVLLLLAIFSGLTWQATKPKS
jgi:hypothetical protein